MTKQFTFNIVLISPEIPHNTGNIIRLCANLGARLHLVKPLGFKLFDPKLKRAALDYGDLTDVIQHDSAEAFLEKNTSDQIYGTLTDGDVEYTKPNYQLGDTIIFGSESVGLPRHVVNKIKPQNRIRIPMMPSNRSMNLSNAVSVVAFEMWRQLEFCGSSNNPANESNYFS